MNHSKYCEDVVVKRASNYAPVARGLEMTREFIVKNKLILVGGMAINHALLDAGADPIYEPDALPDYDFLSPDSVKHGAMLARDVCLAGLPNLSVINGIHTSTRKVRVDTIVIADISYCPMFDCIPYMKTCDGIKYIHPHFQMMDVHRALSFPFENPTQAVIFHRWTKDCERYDRLYAEYPITATDNNEVKMVDVDVSELRGVCITGWAALDYYRRGAKPSTTFKVPRGERVQLLSDDFLKFEGTHNDSRAGKMPRSVIGSKYEVFDNRGEKVAANKVGDVWVANLQHVMMWLLVRVYLYGDRVMNDAARAAYLECRALVVDGGFTPRGDEVYGQHSFNSAYIISRERYRQRVSGRVNQPDVPRNYYPTLSKCKVDDKFEYDKSNWFALSGQPSSRPFQEHNIDKTKK